MDIDEFTDTSGPASQCVNLLYPDNDGGANLSRVNKVFRYFLDMGSSKTFSTLYFTSRSGQAAVHSKKRLLLETELSSALFDILNHSSLFLIRGKGGRHLGKPSQIWNSPNRGGQGVSSTTRSRF